MAAALMPIAFGQLDVLVTILVATSATSILVHPLTLVAQVRLARALTADADRVRSAALTTLSGGVLVGLIVAAALVGLQPGISSIVAGSCLLLLGLGLFTIVLGDLTRQAKVDLLYAARLTYGFATAGLTLLCCLATATASWFILALAGAYLLATLIVYASSGRARHELMRYRLSLEEAKTEFAASRTLIPAYLISGLASQLPALLVARAAPLAEEWALVLRIVAGFQTTGVQVFGPKFDVALVQADGAEQKTSAFRRATWDGLLLGIAAILVCLMAMYWVDVTPDSLWGGVALAVGGVGYAVGSVGPAPSGKALALLGRDRTRLGWDACRALTFAGATLLCVGGGQIIAVGVAALVTFGLFIFLTRRALVEPDERE